MKKEVEENFEKKTTTANTSISVDCYCPYCGDSQYILYEEDTRLALGNEFSVDDVEIVIECTNCSETFIVTDIYY